MIDWNQIDIKMLVLHAYMTGLIDEQEGAVPQDQDDLDEKLNNIVENFLTSDNTAVVLGD